MSTEDHDSPWKEALELFLQPFLQLLYPDIHEAIDWTQAPTFLDGKEVISGCAGGCNPRYRPDCFEEIVAGSGVYFRFRAVKLLDFRDRMDELLTSENPFALLVAAQLTAKLVKDNLRRADNLIGFYRLAIVKQLDHDLIARLRIFLEWLVDLPPEIKEGYYAEQLKRLLEEQDVPYVSTFEKLAMKEGIQQGIHIGANQGRLEGRAAMLSRLLQLKFGDLSDDVRQRLTQATEAEVDAWAERILFVDSIKKVFG